jgi:hypothetical protein
LVSGRKAVIVESDIVDYTDKQQRPVRPAFRNRDGLAVVDGKEDVRDVGEIWKGFLDESPSAMGEHEKLAGRLTASDLGSGVWKSMNVMVGRRRTMREFL